ncbi:MAG: STAS domain-containing protein [Deferribacteraceae bacterium]|jgi:anti-sigma B factor antagonist|nr:STAS domain-containing protein [Deferribacteraceae bacterium]
MAFGKERNSHGDKVYEVLFPLHEIDSFNGEELKSYITSIADQVNTVIIDFSKIAYLNSSGLRELIQILKILREKNKALFLAQLSDDIKKIFVHTNLDRLFVFHDTLQDAINAANN